jgi:endonuclease/exonuclease/phosphatase family metal-dependent hydrolase
MQKLILFITCLLTFNLYSQEVQKPIKFSSWNIKMLPKICHFFSNKDKMWQEKRLKVIIAFLKNSNTSIIQLQEVFDVDAVKEIQKELKHKFPYIIYPKSQFLKFSNGLMVLSKMPIKLEKTIFFNNHKLHDAFVSKGAILYSLEHDFQKMYIVNTHLQSDYKIATSEILRGQQLAQIMDEIVEPVQKHRSPVLLAGDYNFDLKSKEYVYFVENLNLKETCFEKSDKVYTFDNKNFWNHDVKSETLDHIFILDKNNTISFSNLSLISPKMNDLVDYSDHYGLEISINLMSKYYVMEK